MAIRAAMTTAGASLLTGLLAGDAGYRGPRIPCGTGHLAEFVSYRDKTSGTVLGRVTASRAWYHCKACEQGLAPRDAELGLAGDTMSRGRAKMTARAAAAEPFARGSGLLADLAGVQVSARRMERHAEADGTAAAQVITAQAAAVKGARRAAGCWAGGEGGGAPCPCAASKPADGGKKSGSSPTTRHSPLTSPVRQVDLATYKLTRTPRARPAGSASARHVY
jgi:hypothetical protein